ncbi:MAG: hypothetical protein K2M59_03925 [Muribaculaceae bacterium]|nr:hypothetical protein [Muribaculaceae bacterium]MDE7465559.1 hypothetical protein [Muribaculaceae bacterium]
MSKEIERIRRLAKGWARMEGQTAVLYQKDDGTYGFSAITEEINNPIVEYITPY